MSVAPAAQADFARPSSIDDDRAQRHQRLTRNVRVLIEAHPKTDELGQDDLVEHLAAKHGFDAFDLSIHRVSFGRFIRTLVCVPYHTAQTPGRRDALVALKRNAADFGHPVILVPEGFIQRQPRLWNSRMIQLATEIHVRAEDRVAILVHLIENGWSTLVDCAGIVRHDAPVTVVLNLVAEGVLSMRMDHPIGPNSRVWIADLARA